MAEITVGDRVRLVKLPKEYAHLNNQTGVVGMVVDGEKYLVKLDDGRGVSLTAGQLELVTP